MTTQSGKRVLIVRHGETAYNLQRRYQGQKDIPLTSRGLAQASALAKYLEDEPIHYVFSSDLSRAEDTAWLIAKGKNLTVVILEELRERTYGAWEGMTFEEMSDQYPDEVAKWQKRPFSYAPGRGEYFFQVRSRARKAWEIVLGSMSQRQTAVMVTHGGLMIALFSYLLGIKNEYVFRLKPANASLSIVVVNHDRPELRLFNETCFLEDLDTTV